MSDFTWECAQLHIFPRLTLPYISPTKLKTYKCFYAYTGIRIRSPYVRTSLTILSYCAPCCTAGNESTLPVLAIFDMLSTGFRPRNPAYLVLGVATFPIQGISHLIFSNTR